MKTTTLMRSAVVDYHLQLEQEFERLTGAGIILFRHCAAQVALTLVSVWLKQNMEITRRHVQSSAGLSLRQLQNGIIMSNHKLIAIVLLFVLLIVIAAGVTKQRNELVPEKLDLAKTANAQSVRKTVYVAAQKVPCTGVAPMECLQVREQADQPWQYHYSGIEGFDFQPGTEYQLQIIETVLNNPPADGSSVRWTLEKIVEQRVVSKQSAPN
ncbi:DUF4377 domain-containing protein [Undibacterium crateris]|uniref:DUF4377 domain-containing protein n=1 Tax=Undibacterium crateris TaxID=2528175 RepID=UPI002E2D097A|nr:DUF4377 domain-containing protein [Undibacterium crateris]